MVDKPLAASIKPPKRVQILKVDDMDRRSAKPYWKPGQFGYVQSYTTYPGMHTESGVSQLGELVFLVSKKPHGGGGAWFSAEALRFTSRAPHGLLGTLSDEERIAVDLLLQRGNGHDDRLFAELVPNTERRAYVRVVAAEMRSLRAR